MDFLKEILFFINKNPINKMLIGYKLIICCNEGTYKLYATNKENHV